MSKAISYFDWELNLKKKSEVEKSHSNEDKEVNSLGIPKSDFRTYVQKWQEENL